MQIEIDTGSRLDTSGDTTFAFSNDGERVVLVRQSVRDECLRRIPGSRLKRELRLFAACVYILIRDRIEEIEDMTIDREYPGHEEEIRWILFNLLKRDVPEPASRVRITFRSIGKKSRAHGIAWRCYRGERSPDGVLSMEELLAVLKK